MLQGLIQIAAGFHKVLGGDAGGRAGERPLVTPRRTPAPPRAESAARLLARGLAKLDAGPRILAGHDLATFGDGVRAWALTMGDGAIDRARVPRLLPPAPLP